MGARILTRQNQICSLPCYADLRRGTFHLWVGPGQSYFETAEGKLGKLDKLVLTGGARGLGARAVGDTQGE
jgi:hypothetical protein